VEAGIKIRLTLVKAAGQAAAARTQHTGLLRAAQEHQGRDTQAGAVTKDQTHLAVAVEQAASV